MTIPAEMEARDRLDLCRRHVESAEAWLRKLVHFELSKTSGANYILAGQFKKEIKDQVSAKLSQNSGRIRRQIDATTFEQLRDIICKQDLWKTFAPGLKDVYPDGLDEARTFIDRLRLIRNDVSHGRQCSARQLERAICYGNDIADSVKQYFADLNMAKEFDVPAITSYVDNVGNHEHLASGDASRSINLSIEGHQRLHPGDVLVAEVEVDPSFPDESYEVEWWIKTRAPSFQEGKMARIEILITDVSERMELQFKVKSRNAWHRSGDVDDVLDIYYKVLPPPQ